MKTFITFSKSNIEYFQRNENPYYGDTSANEIIEDATNTKLIKKIDNTYYQGTESNPS